MLIFDHLDHLEKAVVDLSQWVKDGLITTEGSETVVEAKFEQLPEVYQRLFVGANQGKLITKLVSSEL